MFQWVLSTTVVGALALLTASEAQAYGVTHTGHTSVSPTGQVQHSGSTTATGAYGNSYSTSHTGTTSASGGSAYHSGSTTASGPYGGASASSSGYRSYSPSAYGSYSGGGSVNAYHSASVVRYP